SPATALNTGQRVTEKQAQTDLFVDVFRGLTLRGGYRYIRGDATVMAGNLSQSGPQEVSELHRNVGIFGFNFRPIQRLTFHGEYEGSSGDRVFFRTSLNEYHRGRLNAKVQVTNALLFQVKFRILDNQNPASDIQLDFRSRDTSAALFWTPGGG